MRYVGRLYFGKITLIVGPLHGYVAFHVDHQARVDMLQSKIEENVR
jgi:hypothetical protein